MEQMNYAPADKIVGHKIADSLGHTYGKITDIIFSNENGKAVAVIVAVDGWFNSEIGSDYIVLPWKGIRINPNNFTIMHDISKQAVKGAPKIDPSELKKGNNQEINKLLSYYGVKPFLTQDRPPKEKPPMHSPAVSGHDIGEKHPSNEGSHQITKHYPGSEGSNTKEEADYDKMKGISKDK